MVRAGRSNPPSPCPRPSTPHASPGDTGKPTPSHANTSLPQGTHRPGAAKPTRASAAEPATSALEDQRGSPSRGPTSDEQNEQHLHLTVIVASRGRGGWAPAHWRQADEGRPLPQSSWFHASVQTCWATPATKRASRVRKPNRHLQQDQCVGVFHFAAQVNKAIVAKAQVGPIHHPPTPASTPVATGRRQVVDHRKRPIRAVRQSDHSPQGRSRAQPPPHRLDPAHVGGITGGGGLS